MEHDFQKHLSNMVDFYESGIKSDSQKLGVELEWTLVHNDNTQVTYDEEFGQFWLMEALKDKFSEHMLDERGNVIGVSNSRDSVTLEPSGQFELSAGPFDTLDEVKSTFSDFFQHINEVVNPHNIQMIATGYHPKCKAEELKLIPKVRYALMNEYFLKNSPLGIRMMRATGSTQVSIDYSSEQDCVRKLRVAYLLTPIFALLCDNTPVFEGQKRTHHLMRTQVWEDCDKRRCGTVPGLFDENFSFEAYAKHVLNTQAMFEMDGSEGHLTNKTTSEVYGNKTMDADACAHASSHLFNDVRLKNFIEIRPADALPTDVAVSYVSLIKGIFYCENALAKTEELLYGKCEKDIEEAKTELQKFGFEAQIYGKNASEIASDIIKFAEAGLNENEKQLLEPIKQIVSTKTTLADAQAPLN